MMRLVRIALLVVTVFYLALSHWACAMGGVFYFATERWYLWIGEGGGCQIHRGWHNPGSGWRSWSPDLNGGLHVWLPYVTGLLILATLTCYRRVVFVRRLDWGFAILAFLLTAAGMMMFVCTPAAMSLQSAVTQIGALVVPTLASGLVGVLLYSGMQGWRDKMHAPKPETICRCCRVVLRGLEAPICPACGERI